MKHLKHIVSVLSAVLLLCGMLPSAMLHVFATDSNTVTVNSNKADLVMVDQETADENAIVHVSISEGNYIADMQHLTVSDSSQNRVNWNFEEGGFYFTMPDSSVTVDIDFYNIIVPDYLYGTVTADKTLAESGTTVTLTATPNANYKLAALSVKNNSDEVIESFDIAEDQTEFTFTMPDKFPVSAEAEFSYAVPDAVSVNYIDADGNTSTQEAIPLTGHEPWTYNYGADIHLDTDGWYVVQNTVDYENSYYSGFAPNLIADGTVNLILCDGATLSGIGDFAGDTFKIYGQTNSTGSTSVNKLRSTNLNLYGGSLTVSEFSNVSEINVTGGTLSTTNQLLDCDTLTISGGAVTAPSLVSNNITLSGGSLTVTDSYYGFGNGGHVSVRCFDSLIMTGGRLNVAEDLLINKKVSLGWTNISDSVKIGYAFFADPDYEGLYLTSVFTDGTKQYDVGSIGSSDISRKTLYPFSHLVGHSISLDGDIGVNFYMELSESVIEHKDTAYMHFTIPVGNGTTEQDMLVKDALIKEWNGKEYYVFKCRVAAKEMTSQIKAQIIDGDESGVVYSYSVKEYADYLLAHAAEKEEWTQAAPLVTAMLDYGAYAKEYFEKASTLDNLGSVEITKPIDTYNLPESVTFSGATLSLKSETSLSLYFKGVQLDNVTCVDKEENVRTFEIISSGGYQIVRIRNIAAKELKDSFTVKFTISGEEYSVVYSPMNYCYNALNGGTSDANLQNVIKALYLYSQAANDYFN